MAKTFRLSDKEDERIRRKCNEINKILVEQGCEPIKDSEFLHKVLDKAINMAKVSESGDILIKEP